MQGLRRAQDLLLRGCLVALPIRQEHMSGQNNGKGSETQVSPRVLSKESIEFVNMLNQPPKVSPLIMTTLVARFQL